MANKAVYSPIMDDLVDTELEGAIQTSKSLVDSDPQAKARLTKLKSLQKNYARIKDREGVSRTINFIQVWTFEGSTAPDQPRGQQFKITGNPREETLAQSISSLGQFVQRACSPGGLLTIGLSLEPLPRSRQQIFSSWHIMKATIRFQVKELADVPRLIVHLLLERLLSVPIASSISQNEPDVHDGKRALLQPPSMKIVSVTLDPLLFDSGHLVLRWQREAPKFSSDTDIYMWQPHTKIPGDVGVDVRLRPFDGEDDRTMTIAFEKQASLQTFTEFIMDDIKQSLGPSQSTPWFKSDEIVRLMLLTYKVMIHETTKFLQECSVQIDILRPEIRKSPSASKLRYLVHLEDCRLKALDGVDHGQQILPNIKKWLDSRYPAAAAPGSNRADFAGLFSEAEKDLMFLHEELEQTRKLVEELQKSLREHLELSNTYRNSILSFVAAVYLPISVAASIFGMNLSASTPPGESGFSDFVESWISESSPSDNQNFTKAVVETINENGNLSFSWVAVMVTMLCLTATLPLALCLLPGVRFLYRNMIRYWIYWRFSALLFLVITAVFSMFGRLMPGETYYIYTACNFMFYGITAMQAFRAIRVKAWRLLGKLILGGGTIIVCFSMDVYFVPAFPLTILAWIIGSGIIWYSKLARIWSNRRLHYVQAVQWCSRPHHFFPVRQWLGYGTKSSQI